MEGANRDAKAGGSVRNHWCGMIGECVGKLADAAGTSGVTVGAARVSEQPPLLENVSDNEDNDSADEEPDSLKRRRSSRGSHGRGKGTWRRLCRGRRLAGRRAVRDRPERSGLQRRARGGVAKNAALAATRTPGQAARRHPILSGACDATIQLESASTSPCSRCLRSRGACQSSHGD